MVEKMIKSKRMIINIIILSIIILIIYTIILVMSIPKTVRFAYFPILEEAPAYIAYEKGFWKKRGLNVTFVEMHGGAEGIYVLTGGEADISGASATDILYAVARGIKLKIICAVATDDPRDPQHAILVRKDSDIYSPEDLRGKTIAVFKLGNIDDIMLRVYLKRHNIDPEKDVTIVEIPLPQLLDALLSGSVDAIITLEPFKTFALDTGQVRILSYYINETIGKLYFAYQIVLENYLVEHEDIVRGFLAGLYEGIDYALEHPNETAEITSRYTGVPPDVIMRCSKVIWPKGITREIMDNLRLVYNIMKEYGYLEEDVEIDIDNLFWKGSITESIFSYSNYALVFLTNHVLLACTIIIKVRRY